ncbi:alpha/beta hydrolase family protein [Actinokineospora sp. HUAS TT18]|uniref:alpha/beta hydrolase family protein n=1 Tax=Actinokineospora sp. HUAS TT18 TaxID=3447451 RepID=UPI003F5250AF
MLVGTGVAHADPVALPEPSGAHDVGVTTLHLVDPTRKDPWDGSVRELMATVFYPARNVRKYPLAPQMTAQSAAYFAQIDVNFAHPELPKTGVDWAGTMTHAHVDAPPKGFRRPVLIYSPGTADPRTINSGLAEDLASRGFVVVTVDHPGETTEVEFPGGRMRTIGLPADPRTNPQVARTILDTRLADLRFVIDELEELATGGSRLGRAMDVGRIGLYGHSVGGTAAAQVMFEDRRVAAAVNLEGYLDYQDGELLPITRTGTDRPLLMLGTDGFRDERYDRTWSALLSHGGPVRVHRLTNATHGVFTDFASMAPQFQAAGLMTADDRDRLVGAVDPAVSVHWVRHHVASFFAKHLR